MAYFTPLEKLILLQLKERMREQVSKKSLPAESKETLWRRVEDAVCCLHQGSPVDQKQESAIHSGLLDTVQADLDDLKVALTFLEAEEFVTCDRYYAGSRYSKFRYSITGKGLSLCREFEQEI